MRRSIQVRPRPPACRAWTAILLAAATAAHGATIYVWTNSPSPSAPYTNWSTAARDIQSAVNAASPGDTVLVTNGVYDKGGLAVAGAMTSRIAVVKPLTVRSVNGPKFTIIAGRGVGAGGTNNGDGAVRCAYLTNGACMSGFTLTNGHTLATNGNWGAYGLYCGGGIYGDVTSSNAVVSNCVVSGSSSHGYGGGAFFVNLHNCLLAGNFAGDQGGGAHNCRLFNCTVVGNSNGSGPGSGHGTIYGTCDNCVVWSNGTVANFAATTFDHSCTLPAPTSGVGNITLAPLFADAAADYRLQSNSPCLNAGATQAWMSGALDLDGNARVQGGAVDMGAYELAATFTTHYVWTNSPSPAPPYATWATAARDIQSAISACAAGDLVLVTNGVYDRGGVAFTGSVTNRVALTNIVRVASVNGPDVTTIVGGGVYGSNNAVRCAYVADGAALAGFTLLGGTVSFGTNTLTRNGGGVYCQGSLATVSNCVIVGCRAFVGGGGAGPVPPSGNFYNCEISGNRAKYGAGTYGLNLYGCTLSTNASDFSGGACEACVARDSTFSGNTSVEQGGGVSYCTLFSCVISSNTSGLGGGALDSDLHDCLVVGNTARGSGGGAASNSKLYGCHVHGNRAHWGGGIYYSTAYHSTIVDNAADRGGGVHSSYLYNSIAYHNRARYGENWLDDVWTQTVHAASCSTPLLPGAGNFTNEPGLTGLDNPHIVSNSPCRDAANPSFTMEGADFDGEPRTNGPMPDVGCDEYDASSFTSALYVAISATYTSAVVGAPLTFSARIDGKAPSSRWYFGDPPDEANRPIVQHKWDIPGAYTVRLSAQNYFYGVTNSIVVTIVPGRTNYVAPGGGHVPPFTTWATAATSIQAAVDANTGCVGAITLVSNGVYVTGGTTPVGAITSRVAVASPVVLRSVNGAAATTIMGRPGATGTNGDNAVRCLYVGRGALVEGFTLEDGHTLVSGDDDFDRSGGGAWCAGSDAVVSSCLVQGNAADRVGGGVMGGTIVNSVIQGNQALFGAGMRETVAERCTIVSNLASIFGGGAAWSTLYSCLVAGNSAGTSAGGSDRCVLYNCTVVFNAAAYSGGGVDGPSFSHNCIVVSNSAAARANWTTGCTFEASCSTPLPPGAGNISTEPRMADSAAGDYRLRGDSPCRNSGTNQAWMAVAFAVDGAPRVIEGAVDMGAYEFYPPGPLLLVSTNTLLFRFLDSAQSSTQSLVVGNSGSGFLKYSITTDAAWLSVSPSAGTSTGEQGVIAVVASSAGLFPGIYTGAVTVVGPAATNSPQAVSVTMILDPDFGLHLGAPALTWTTGGELPWFVQSNTTYDGVNAAQSGGITNNQQSWLEVGVQGPGTLSFWWKVSSEATFDLLAFYIDGTQRPGRVSGEVDWQQQVHAVGPGAHALRWRYSKDSGGYAGKDAGWLDEAAWTSSDDNTNGIPDWWELQNFGSLTSVTVVSDWDGDRLLDLDEYRAGTSPTNPVSYLGFVDAGSVPAGVSIVWQSVADRRYRLDRGTNLLSGFTTTLMTNIPATPPMNGATDETATGTGPWLYRVGLEP